MDLFKKIDEYLKDEFGYTIIEPPDDDSDFYDRTLASLIQDYAKAQREEAYKKGFLDGEEEMSCK